MKYDAVIIGAGISGLFSALVLAKERKNVLVLEKSSVIGGNCRSYLVDGFQVDTGAHAITSLKKGPLVTLMDKYFDIVPKFLPHGHYYVRDGKKLQIFPYTLQGFARFGIISKKDRILLAHALLDATKNHTIQKESLDMSVYDFIKSYKLSSKAISFIDIFCYFLSGKSMHETPVWRILSGGGTTDELSHGMKNKISGIVGIVRNTTYLNQGYPLGGIKSITNAIIASFPENRVTICTDEKVIKIQKNMTTFTTATEKHKYKSGTIIYSAEIKNLPKILENKIPKSFKGNISTLKQTRSMTLWLGLKRKREEFNYTGSEVLFKAEIPFWAMPTSNYDPQFAPKGMQLIGFTSIIIGNKTQKEQKHLLLNTIKKTYPGIEKDIVMQHVQVTVPEKAAITVGARFPGPKGPISGLYLAGTDTDKRSMGITRAAHSVVEMIDLMKKDKFI